MNFWDVSPGGKFKQRRFEEPALRMTFYLLNRAGTQALTLCQRGGWQEQQETFPTERRLGNGVTAHVSGSSSRRLPTLIA
jgi:hypothetical protein